MGVVTGVVMDLGMILSSSTGCGTPPIQVAPTEFPAHRQSRVKGAAWKPFAHPARQLRLTAWTTPLKRHWLSQFFITWCITGQDEGRERDVILAFSSLPHRPILREKWKLNNSFSCFDRCPLDAKWALLVVFIRNCVNVSDCILLLIRFWEHNRDSLLYALLRLNRCWIIESPDKYWKQFLVSMCPPCPG